MVCPDRRSEHGASSVAVRQLGGEEGPSRGLMAHTRLGGDGPQDSALDPVNEVKGSDSDALVACGLS